MPKIENVFAWTGPGAYPEYVSVNAKMVDGEPVAFEIVVRGHGTLEGGPAPTASCPLTPAVAKELGEALRWGTR